MNASVEISYYPLNQDFIPHIIDFITRINEYDFVIKTNGMSTQIFGEYDKIMNALTIEIKKSFQLPHSIFMIKIVNANLQ